MTDDGNDDYDGNYDDGGLCDADPAYNVQRFLGNYIHPFIVLVGLLGNLLVIVTYAYYKKTKSMTDVYLLNVAVADVLFVVVLPLIIYNEQNEWPMGDYACKLLQGAYSLNLYSGLLLLGCISCDRYLAIVFASRSRYLRSRTLVYSHAICILVWLVALLLSLPSFIYSEKYQETMDYISVNAERRTEESTSVSSIIIVSSEDASSQFTTTDLNFPKEYNHTGITKAISASYSMTLTTATSIMTSTTDESDLQHWVEPAECLPVYPHDSLEKMKVIVPSLQMAVGFLLPLMVMAFCYSSVILTLLKARNFQRHRAVYVVLTVVLVFVFCHLPYNLVLLIHTVTLHDERECSDENALLIGLGLTRTLAYLHCCLNPFLYAFVGERFRNHFKKILMDLMCKGKEYRSARRRSSRLTSEVVLSSRRSIDSNTDNGTSLTM